MPVIVVGVISTHILLGPKARKYVFRVLAGEVQVERWEGPKLVSRRAETVTRARRMYRWLVASCGYNKW